MNHRSSWKEGPGRADLPWPWRAAASDWLLQLVFTFGVQGSSQRKLRRTLLTRTSFVFQYFIFPLNVLNRLYMSFYPILHTWKLSPCNLPKFTQ